MLLRMLSVKPGKNVYKNQQVCSTNSFVRLESEELESIRTSRRTIYLPVLPTLVLSELLTGDIQVNINYILYIKHMTYSIQKANILVAFFCRQFTFNSVHYFTNVSLHFIGLHTQICWCSQIVANIANGVLLTVVDITLRGYCC